MKKIFADFSAFISMSVPALFDPIIVLEKSSQSQEFPFHCLSVEADTLRSRLEKVSSSRPICSGSWEQKCDRYCTCPEYFSEELQSTTNKYDVDCRSLSKTRVVVIR